MRDLGHATKAHDYFLRVLETYIVSLVGARIIATHADPVPLIEAQLQIRNETAGTHSQGRSYHDGAKYVHEMATELEQENELHTLRASTLISLCSALENLWKCLLVDHLIDCPDLVSHLPNQSHKFTIAEVLNLEDSEKLFLVADKLFLECAAGKPHFDRFKYLLVDLLPRNPALPTCDVSRFNKSAFNEAYLVRNILVHNGGRVDQWLSKQSTGYKRGDYFDFRDSNFKQYQEALDEVAKTLRDLIPSLQT
jgi:hypothetical protein